MTFLRGNSVVNVVRNRRHGLVAINRPSSEEMQPICDSMIVGITLVDISMTRSQVSCEETEAGVMVVQSDTDCALVPRHSSKTGL